jgi:AIPR protein
MDRVSEAILREFSEGRDLLHLGRDEQFENLICLITVGRHYSETFDTEEIVVGNGVPGIDGIAIIVNGVLMSDVDSLDELDPATELDVTFIFIQADAGASFDAAKIGSFGHAVLDFFNEKPALPQNKKVKTSAELMWALYKRGAKFKKGRPNCRLYFATTGKWVGDHILVDRIQTVISDLDATVLFREIDFDPLGAEEIQKFYQQSKNAIERDFVFKQNLTIPETPGITEAYLGFVPVPEIYKLLIDDTDNMMGNLYYSNPRDWQDYNQVNEEIKKTLGTDAKSRFVLMNNGITIIARSITRRGDIFTLEDYQIVNGCQTCHVIFEQADSKDESVTVPIRLISTQDEQIINSIIRATN